LDRHGPINLPVNSRPLGLAVNEAGTRLYVANNQNCGPCSGTVSVIDTTANAVIAAVEVGDNPFALAMHPDGTRVYVGSSSHRVVSVLDTAQKTVMATVEVGTWPLSLAVHPKGDRL